LTIVLGNAGFSDTHVIILGKAAKPADTISILANHRTFPFRFITPYFCNGRTAIFSGPVYIGYF
jgi:hypothetical protein